MNLSHVVPTLLVLLVAWRIYRRVPRNIRPQPLRPGRMIAVIVFFSAISLLLLRSTRGELPMAASLGVGLLAGFLLGWRGLRLAQFERTSEGEFCRPNTQLGIALTVLLVARLAYHLLAGSGSPTPALSMQSPLTLGLFGVTAGYYIAYYAGVLRRRRLERTA